MKSELVPADGGPPITITRDVTVLGRREFCDVQIDDSSLSKRHAVLVRTDGLLIVRDLASTNGTKVNGQRVMWAALMPNDRLTLGRFKFKVYLGPDTAPAPSETYRPGTPAGRPAPAIPSSRRKATPPDAVVLAPPLNVPGSTDPDAEVIDLDEFILDDEEPIEIDLD